jgi:hypothetical protein
MVVVVVAPRPRYTFLAPCVSTLFEPIINKFKF